MSLSKILKNFLLPKAKFAVTSAVATALDYGIYLTLTLAFAVSETVSHAVSYSLAMILNFLLQRRFIFQSKRKTSAIFAMSIMFSLIGWILSQAIFNLLIFSFSFFHHWDILAKILTTAVIFLYNFYTKRYSFERKFPLESIVKSGKKKRQD